MRCLATTFLLIAACLPASGQSSRPTSRPVEPVAPEGFRQILPRGRIAAINDPGYVPAGEARINDDAWILGVVVEGKALAYSLNLLNRHEIVNDRVGETAFAAVW